MATPQSAQESQTLESFVQELRAEIRVLKEGRDHRNNGYGSAKRSEAADLNFRHPVYGVIGRQIDAATVFVRAIEDYINKETTFCIPVHCDIGMLRAPYRGAHDNFLGHATTDLTTDPSTHYALAVIRTNNTWRIAIYRWTIFGTPNSEQQERGAQSCKPWLESSYMDKAVTIPHLPRLVEKLLTQVQLLVHVATSNGEALSKLGDIVKSFPTE